MLTAGPTPRIDLADWRLKVEGLVARPREWTWEEIQALPGSSFEGDIHCVTRWSKLGTSFAGVSVDTLLEAVEPLPAASHVVAFCYGGYTTNLPLDDLQGGKAWVVWEHEGAPLPAEHGGPARLLVPHLYLWKSAKWLAGLRLLDHDAPGFWESLGYHNRRRSLAGGALLGRLSWRLADVAEVRPETDRVVTLALEVPGWDGHLPGQHVDVRLTAEDGYQAERAYSIASAPDGSRVELAVERLEDGEVSPYLAGELRKGDQLELRGPVGGYFVWEPDRGGPLLLVAGGSGVVPLMAMLRRRAAAGSEVPARLLYSSRTLEDVIFREELERLEAAGDGLTVTHALTRAQPAGWAGYARRIDAVMLEEVGWRPGERPLAYVCGPTRLVEAVAGHLVALGHDPSRVRTERFGPTGVP